MSIDGRILARAKEKLDAIKLNNEKKLDRRREEVYARIPAVKAKDAEIRKLMTGLPAAALARKDGAAELVGEIERKSLELYADRAELLVAGGYAAEYLDEIHNCAKCRDRGYTPVKPCSCLMELYENEREKDRGRQLKIGGKSFSEFRLDYYDAVPDPSTGISCRDMMERVSEGCRSYCNTFGSNSMNLLFTGNTGAGKTFLASCMAETIRLKGFTVVYETVPAAIEAFEIQKFSRSKDDSEDSAKLAVKLTDCDFLILDDLGSEMITVYSLSAIYTLINSRLLSNGKTVIITNLPRDELKRIYTPQIVSRLEGEYSNLKFVGQDIRALKKARGV